MMGGEPEQASLLEPGRGHRRVGLGASGHGPPAEPRRGDRPPVPGADAEPTQEASDRLRGPALAEPDAPEPPPQPLVQPAQRSRPGVAEVRDPARGEGVDLRDHPCHRGTPVAAGDPAQALLDPGEAVRRDIERAVRVHPVAEERPFPDRCDRALLPVDPEPEPPFQEGGERSHHPLPRRLGPHIDIAVVGIAAEGVAAPLELPVQVVEKKIGQERRQGAAPPVKPEGRLCGVPS